MPITNSFLTVYIWSHILKYLLFLLNTHNAMLMHSFKHKIYRSCQYMIIFILSQYAKCNSWFDYLIRKATQWIKLTAMTICWSFQRINKMKTFFILRIQCLYSIISNTKLQLISYSSSQDKRSLKLHLFNKIYLKI